MKAIAGVQDVSSRSHVDFMWTGRDTPFLDADRPDAAEQPVERCEDGDWPSGSIGLGVSANLAGGVSEGNCPLAQKYVVVG